MSVTLYTTTTCGYCRAAKSLLVDRGIPFDEIDLTNDPEKRIQVSAQAGNYRTVPMIFIHEEFIGGYQELHALDQSGQLQAKVAKK